jgi:ankyrin repeat protein
MIAAIAIDHLSAQRSLCGVAYVYCNYKDQEGKDSSSMLAAILKQLVQARPSVMHLIEPWHQQHTNEGTNPSLDEIVNKLKDVLTYCRTNYIVIDALDECRDSDGTRRQFLTKLQDLRAGRDLRLMVTSRVIPEVVDEFRHAIWLEVQANEEDIKLFITGQTYRLPGCIQRSPTLQNMVQDKIVEAADGMFLLASLHTDSLLDKRTTKDVKSTLATLSKGSKALEGAYRDALYRIKGQLGGDYELAKSVLSWITSAKRPLTTAELCYALAVEVDETEIDPENIHDAEDFVSVCAGLVVIDQESTIIRLVHYTTQEYFESIRDTWNPVIQQQIATACLAYLSFDTFRSGPSSTDEELEERLQQHKFLDYAANHWGEHAREVEPEISDLACSFLLRSGSLLSASQVSSSSRLKNLNYSQSYVRITALQCAAQFGLFRVTQKLLPKSKKEAFEAVNTMDSWDRTPLELAAENGHHKVAMLLIEKGAHVNGEVGESCNGLQEASYRGHDQVVKLLLDKGANANAEGIHYYKGESCYNALQAASLGGHEQVVKLLLNKGANVNAEGGFYGNALQAASYEGHEHIVELLLSSGASVNMQGGTYINALKAASFGGHEQVVKLLLDRGASINMKDSPFDNALQEASYRGHEHIVKLLLDRGADINAGGRNSGNALYVASSGGHEHIVKLLLDRGANICAEGGYHGTALQAASYAGYKHIVELLLDRGVNIHAEGGEYANALQAASCGGYEHIVKLLLDRGANINTEGGFFGNALQAASCRGHEHIVKLLLDRGANINAEGGIYDNALQAALIGGYGHIVKLLLEKGANAKVGGGKYGIVY